MSVFYPLLAQAQQLTDAITPGGNGESTTQPPPLPADATWLQRIEAAWNYPLYSSGGEEVLLNQLVLAVLIAIVGILVARIVTGIIAARMRKINRIGRHAGHMIQRILFYILTVIIVLVALPIAGIPITIFAVLGGAVAIGVGFGAQNLCNNLISGMIIMLERPIRIGDIVEVDDHEGRVEAINNRATRVRRTDGIDLLVPNSKFLENTIINWTLSDADVRGKVSVGVAYGSPVRQVETILRQVATEHVEVLTDPEPLVIFEDFGDNALVFDLYFWSTVQRPMDRRRVQSDLRFAINDRLADAGITIAFPQRDVHLDSLSPIAVKMVEETGSDG